MNADTALDRLIRTRRPKPIADAASIENGVTIPWLAEAFRMSPGDVRRRLAGCPPLHRKQQGYLYDLKRAAAYLVKPVFDVAKYLNGMKPSELPPQLQKEFWDSQLKRQLWEERAGDLWRTVKVVEVFSGTFLLMKSTMQLWAEDVEREVGLTAEQRAILVQLTDQLQTDIQKRLLGMQSSTKPMLDEVVIDAVLRPENELEEDLIG